MGHDMIMYLSNLEEINSSVINWFRWVLRENSSVIVIFTVDNVALMGLIRYWSTGRGVKRVGPRLSWPARNEHYFILNCNRLAR